MKTHTNATLGFSISYPESWQAIPAAWMKQQSGRAKSTSPALAKILEQARSPFLFIQDPSMTPGFAISTVRCQAYSHDTISAVGGIPGLFATTQRTLKEAFPDYELIECQPEYVVAGVVGARLLTSMSVRNPEGELFHATSELLCLPARLCVFVVGLSATSDETRKPVQEFTEIVRSIRLH